QDYYALAGVFASTAYKEYPLVSEVEVKAWNKHKEELDTAEKALKQFLDDQSAKLTERFASQIAAYMMATVDPTAAQKLHPKVVARWKAYLAKPEEFHPFLKGWFEGRRTQQEAELFQRRLLEILAEKK